MDRVKAERPRGNDVFLDITAALAVSKKMGEDAGVDLSDVLRDLQSAIAEAYPKSYAAKTYPREVSVARAQIDAALAARRQRN